MKNTNPTLTLTTHTEPTTIKCEHAVTTHEHMHAANCGHKSYVHAGHICYEHDGHFHYMHGDHAHACQGPFVQQTVRPVVAAAVVKTTGKAATVHSIATARAKKKTKKK